MSQIRSQINIGETTATIWIPTKDNLFYGLIAGFYTSDISQSLIVQIYDSKGKLSHIFIDSATVVIDGQRYDLPELTSYQLDMDFSDSNRYAGNGSSGWIQSALPKAPKNNATLMIKGIATDIHNQSKPLHLTIKSERIESYYFLPAFLYFTILPT